MFGAATAAAILLCVHHPAAAAERRAVNVPAGRLGDAVVTLGRQSGINIGVADPRLAGLRVHGVRGRLTPAQALEKMLRGTPARHLPIDANSFRIVRRLPPPPQAWARPAPLRPAPSPSPSTGEDDAEIIVTGTRRSVLLSAYGGPVDIVDGDDPHLEGGLQGTEALAGRLPGIASTHLGSGRNKLFIRGIADSSFNGPTQATAGQYFGETRLNYNAPDPDLRLYDVDRIEVLQGPQGTLYGAGSLGGIIRVTPARPQLGQAEAAISIGGSATWHGDPGADAALRFNLPLVRDHLAVRAVAYGLSEGGYIDDVGRGMNNVNRVRTIGGRVGLRLAAPSGWTLDIGATGQRIRGRDAQFAHADLPPLTRDSATEQPFSSDYLLGELVVTKDWGDTQFVSAVGAVRQDIAERYDATRSGGAASAFDQETRVSLLSAESRLSGGRADSSGWLVGVTFISNDAEQRRDAGPLLRSTPRTGVSNRVEEAALFGEGSLRLSPHFIATAGARLTHSRLAGGALDLPAMVLMPVAGPPVGSRKQTAFLPSLALAYQPGHDLTLFARYQKSFRPGGMAVEGDFIRMFRPDDLGALEAGLRYGRPGRSRFDASASIAYTRWQDIQADTISLSGFPTTANIGDGRIYTLDVRLGWRPGDNLHVELAGIANDSIVTNPAPSTIITTRAPLPNVADVSGRMGIAYDREIAPDLGLGLHASARYTGKSRLGIGAILGQEQGNWLDVSAGARLSRGRHALSLSITNLFDSVGNRFAFGSPFDVVEELQSTPLRPRTVRLGWETLF